MDRMREARATFARSDSLGVVTLVLCDRGVVGGTNGGLSSADAARALAEHGPNELRHEEGPSPWRILASQFSGAMIWLLIGACVVSAAVGEVLDASAIAVIVVLNAIIGFAQEYRAERAMSALRALSAPRARVLR